MPKIYQEKEQNWLAEDGIAEEMQCCTLHKVLRCVTEIAVHVPLGIYRKDYQLIQIEIPDEDF